MPLISAISNLAGTDWVSVNPSGTPASNSDAALSIGIRPDSNTVTIASMPIPAGAATSANQLDQITHETAIENSVASIDSKTPALVSGSVPVTASALPLPAGAATESLQNQILSAIKAQIDLETNVFQDNSGAYYILRTSVDEGTGVVTQAWVDLAGNPATPGAGLRPVGADSSIKVSTTTYIAINSGTGYTTSDMISLLTIVNMGVNPFDVNTSWVNVSTDTVIGAPPFADLSDPLSSLLTQLLSGLTTNNTQMTDGSQKTQVTNFPATQAVSVASLPLPTDAATETTSTGINNNLTNAYATLQSIQPDVATIVNIASAINTDTSAISVDTTNIRTSAFNIEAQLPTALGQGNIGNSFPVVIAVDQSIIPVDITANTIGLATEATLSAIDVKTPALGQSNMAGSVPVTIASDQTTLTVSSVAVGDTTDTAAASGNVTASQVALLKAILNSNQSMSNAASAVDRSLTIAAGGTAQQLVSANASRRSIVIQNPPNVTGNPSSESIYVSFTGTAVVAAAGSFEIMPGETWSSAGGPAPSGAISVIASTTGHVINAFEM